MILSSTEFNAQINNDSRTFRSRIKKGEKVISGEIKKVTICKGACGDNFSVGSIYVPSIEVEISGCSDTLENDEVLLQIGILLDDGTTEYIDMGYYTVTKPKSTVYSTTFTAVGRISAKLNVLSDIPKAQTIVNLAEAITAKTGVPVIFRGLTATGNIEKDLSGLTCKELLEVITSVLGGFATEDNVGNIVISKFGTENPIAYNGDRMTTLPEFNDYDFELYGIKAIVSEEGENEDGNVIPEVAFTEGTPRMVISNPYMTEALFANFATNTVGYSYRPATVPIALGDPRIEPWDSLSVTDVKGNTYTVPCLNIIHTFDGGLSTIITAPGDSESEEESEAKGPITQRLDRMSAELFTAREAIINRLKADDLEAETAKLCYVKADEIDAKLGTFGYLKTDELEAKIGEFGYLKAVDADLGYVKINQTNINTAWVEDLLVKGQFLADSVHAGSGYYSKDLVGVNVSGDIIVGNTVKADALILQGEDGIYRRLNIDSLGQAVVDSNSKYNEKLDGSILVAKSVTAEEIAANAVTSEKILANAVTAQKIDIEDLQTHLARIGDASGNHVLISPNSVDIRNGDDVLASFGANMICLGKNNNDVIIDLGNGVAKLYKTYDSITKSNIFNIESVDDLHLISEGLIRLENYSDDGVENSGNFFESSLTIDAPDGVNYGETYISLQTYHHFGMGTGALSSSIELRSTETESTVDISAGGGDLTSILLDGNTGKVRVIGDIILDNNQQLLSYNSAGTLCNLAYVNISNDIVWGSSVLGGQFHNMKANQQFRVRTGETNIFNSWYDATDGRYTAIPAAYAQTTSGGSTVRVGSTGILYRHVSSSRRYKEAITTQLNDELNPEKLYDLLVVQYKYREGHLSKTDQRYGKEFIGLLAEDIKMKYPIAANMGEDGFVENYNIDILVPAMLKLIQNQKKEIDNLKEEIYELQRKLN